MMVQPALLDTTRDIDADLCRNIVSLRQTADLFDDLSDGDPQLSRTAAAAEMRVKATLPGGAIARGFLYSTAIEYPFASEPYLRSRYGDGSYGVWYGAIDMDTSIYETAYHMIQDELRIAGLDEDIVRERAVYDVRCRAALIDVSKKRDSHPDLVAEDYTFTQSLGRRLVNEGHPGLLTPSARRDGTTAAIFSSTVLSNPRVWCYLTYRFSPRYRTVHIERTPGTPYLALRYRDGRLSRV